MSHQHNPWKIRIVGDAEVDPRQLLANPKNWRVHTDAQRKILTDVLSGLGWVQRIIVNRRTGRIIDGHLRVDEAIAHGQSTVPVTYVDVTEEEEEAILRTFDAVTSMAAVDTAKYRDLWASVDMGKLEEDMRSAIELMHQIVDPQREPKPQTIEEIPADEIGGESNPLLLRNDVVFSSSNRFGIPDLLPQLIHTAPPDMVTHYYKDDFSGPHRFYIYRSCPYENLDFTRSILAFYTSDNRFEYLLSEPAEHVERFLSQKWAAIVTPNVSTLPTQPFAEQLWITYRVRWFGRYLQSVGIPIIPDIDWADERSFEFCFLGIPRNPASVAVQLQTLETGEEAIRIRRMGLERIEEELKPAQIIVYGPNRFWIEEVRRIFDKRALVLDSVARRIRLCFQRTGHHAPRKLRTAVDGSSKKSMQKK